MYYALIEIWYSAKNTFLAPKGQTWNLVWEMRNITDLSSLGEYYEEVIPTFKDFSYVKG